MTPRDDEQKGGAGERPGGPSGPGSAADLERFGDVDPQVAQAVRIARNECVRRRHSAVEPAHLFVGLLEAFRDEAGALLDAWKLDRAELVAQARAALPPDGSAAAARVPLSAATVMLLEDAAERAEGGTLAFEHVLLAFMAEEDGVARGLLAPFGVSPEAVAARAREVIDILRQVADAPGTDADEDEDGDDAEDEAKAEAGARRETPRTVPRAKRPTILDELTRDLVEEAREGRLDPVFGREREIDAVLETLSRRTKNNPVLVGEPGVGKSAIVEGLAQRVADGTVPARLRNMRIHELSVADLVAGTQFRGQFEERIRALVDATAEDRDIVLFIDEIHTILAAGGQAGTGDAASLLKPHLARGTLRCIGATTTDEYRRFLEKDRALVRRFQPINVPEPTPEESLRILTGLAPRFEEHHGLKVGADALEAAVTLSKKHLPERHLPDKAIDLIDQACARKVLHEEEPRRQDLTLTAVDVVALLRDQLGKKLGEITLDETKRLLGIEEFLKARIVGQDHVITIVAERIRLARRELDFHPERPNGVFLFLGPTGVGKTEVARCLAEYLNGGASGSEQQLLRYDLSEFSEPHSVSKLIGAPPGYVGYEDEGHQLTSRVRSRPQSVVLLDEIEKAHPSVLNLFLQVFEDGRLSDSQGRTVSFSETTIILTSNIGAEAFGDNRAIGFVQQAPSPEETRERAREILKDHLPPELLNRVDRVAVFNPLGAEAIQEIARRLVKRVADRFARQGKTIDVDAQAIHHLGATGYEPAYGARHLQRNIEQLLLQPLARETYLSDWTFVERVKVTKEGSALAFEKVYRNVTAPA